MRRRDVNRFRALFKNRRHTMVSQVAEMSSVPNTPYLIMPDKFLYETRQVWTENDNGDFVEKSFLCRITDEQAYLDAFGVVPEDLKPNTMPNDDDE